MKKINQKRICRAMAEQRGASILLALFLMLVVLAVGAVILTAGVAAGGRRSEIAKMDQRYYSVGSAAGVFRELIEGQSVTVVREMVTEKETQYKITVDDDGNAHRGNGSVVSSNTEYDVYLDGSTKQLKEEADKSLLTRAAVDLIDGYENPQTIFGLDLPNMAEEKTHPYTLSHSGVPEDISDAALDVEIVMTVEPGGDLRVTLTSEDAETGDTYSVTEVFMLTLSHRESSNSESGTPEITGGGDSYYETVTKVTTTVKKDTFTWVFDSMDINR